MILPYLIVIAISLILALLELLSTFGRSMGDILRSKWGYALIAFNVVAALSLYVIIRFGLNAGNDLVTAFAVGATYPTLLRNPLTFSKSSTGKEGQFQTASFELLNHAYETVLTHCKTEALIWDADRRSRKAERLVAKYSGNFHALEQLAQNLIVAQRDPALKEQQQKKLGEAMAYEDRADRRMAVALALIEFATPERIQELLDAP